MAKITEGQQIARQERNESYTQWTGAQEVQADGTVKQATAAPSSIVEQELNAIRQAIRSGVAHVRLDISDEVIIEAIKGFLTPEELKHVQFGSEESSPV